MLRNLFKGGDKKQVEPEVVEEKENWFNRLKSSLEKTRNRFVSQLSGLLRVGRKMTKNSWKRLKRF